MPDREQRLLAMLLAFDPVESPYAEEFAEGAPELDWEKFQFLVTRHRVAALIHAGLAKSTQISPPAKLREHFAHATSKNAQEYLRAVKVAGRLTTALQDAGIACSLLKGVAVAARYYEQPSQREMIDIDLLVAAERFEDAQAIVAAQGFELFCPNFAMSNAVRDSYKVLNNAFAFVRREDGLQIDLHWRMVQNPALLPWLETNWPQLVMLDHSMPIAVPALRPAPHFLFITAHGAKSGWVRLKWLVDVDRVVRVLTDIEIDEVTELAGKMGTERLLAASLVLSHRILGTPLPIPLKQLAENIDTTRLNDLELPLIFGPSVEKQPRLRDWQHFTGRIEHSLSLHQGKGFKRKALLRELAGTLDLKTLPLSPRWLWLLALATPLMAVGRSFRRKIRNGRS
ncbi:MAG: nucleotidyltransferase family protein [Pontixanthobacter sp.]